MDNNISDIETLIVTMEMNDPICLLKHMNIQTNFVIGNQSDSDKCEKVVFNDLSGLIVSRSERGVGRNRNTVLGNAKGKICVLADDDMVFVEGYPNIVKNCFSENSDADVIIFNLLGDNAYEGERKTKKKKNISLFNYMNYGAARIAFRRNAILYKGIMFNLCFGGGTIHQCGEDSLFLRQCLKAGLKVVAVEQSIATINAERESTWFNGYNDKYFFDKGVFLKIAHPSMACLFAAYLVIRHNEYTTDDYSKIEVFRKILKGIRYASKECR